MSEQIVKLNVGGVFYDTSLQTLLVEGSYFSSRFSGNWDEERDENGRIFIDRDGRAFEYVLDFLRNGSRMVFPESAEMRNRVCREADFYILPELVELLKSDVVQLDVGGFHYTTTRRTLTDRHSGASQTSAGMQYFYGLLNSQMKIKKDLKGRIVVDRDGKAFEYVLDYMRNGDKMVLPQSDKMKERIHREAQFYKLSGLEDLMESALSATVDLRIGWKRKGYQKRQQYQDLSLNLARFKMYPGNWFEQTFSTNDVDLPTAEKGIYMLDRKENYAASAIVAEYVGSSEREVIKNLAEDEFEPEGIFDAVAFFGFPQALAHEIVTHLKKIKNIPEF